MLLVIFFLLEVIFREIRKCDFYAFFRQNWSREKTGILDFEQFSVK